MKKGIIYVRVSSVDQTQGTSLDNQERACLTAPEFLLINGFELLDGLAAQLVWCFHTGNFTDV